MYDYIYMHNYNVINHRLEFQILKYEYGKHIIIWIAVLIVFDVKLFVMLCVTYATTRKYTDYIFKARRARSNILR